MNLFGQSSIENKLISAFDWLSKPVVTLPESERRQTKLLAWILLFMLLFSIAILFAVLIFNPHADPDRDYYDGLIVSLVVFLTFIYGLNRAGRYRVSALLLVVSAALTPWASLMFDSSILQGDFVPLIYLTFSVLLSSILLPTSITILVATVQFAGVTLVLLFSSATSAFNWFSFLAYVFLTSVFSILANSIIQRNMREIESQTHQLTLNERRLQDLSIRDYLTNLFNRRYLEETLEREIQRAARTQHPLGVIMLDIDHFKRINDTLGHAAGDRVLQEFGEFLAEQIRPSDIACRYGGDEFVLILPDTSRDVAMERAEHLRENVKQLAIKHENGITITISQGVAVFPQDGSTGEMILKSADAALYRVKHESNLVVTAV